MGRPLSMGVEQKNGSIFASIIPEAAPAHLTNSLNWPAHLKCHSFMCFCRF